jgi:GNAT superfamily N-acetyltransferase
MKISLRHANDSDKAFCRQVHHEAYRDVVVRQFGVWDEAQQDSFFDEGWRSSAHEVIDLDGMAIGCFSRHVCEDHIFLAEVQLLPQFQRRGIGTEIVRRQQNDAQNMGIPLRLRVLNENRARQLYERLGFVVSGETATHTLMEWKANHGPNRTVAPRGRGATSG